jgi:predicted metal-binding protein
MKAAGRRRDRGEEARLIEMALKLGAKDARMISPGDVVTAEWVRWKCRFGCGGYGSSLCCPPNSPTPAETRRLLDGFKRAILFEAGRGEPKKIAVALERELFLAGYYRAFGLGEGPCRLCEKCAFGEGCRHPRQARPAMEACGIDVFTTVRRHGFTINVVQSRTDMQHYFGMVLID